MILEVRGNEIIKTITRHTVIPLCNAVLSYDDICYFSSRVCYIRSPKIVTYSAATKEGTEMQNLHIKLAK